MKQRTLIAVRCITALSALTLLAWNPAYATLFMIDDFSVTLNGSTIFNDPFDDGNPPPSAPDYSTGESTSYVSWGVFPTEADSKLSFDPNFGVDTINPEGYPIRVSGSRLLRNV